MSTPSDRAQQLASRLGVHAVRATCSAVTSLSPNLTEVVFQGAAALGGVPGNDVMVEVTLDDGTTARRRYSIRHVDAERDELSLWINTHHQGPGARFLSGLAVEAELDLVGPRGKITLDPLADWHLFMGDLSALGSFYRMADAIEVPGRAIFIVELDDAADAVTASFNEQLGVTGIFVDRQGRAGNDPEGLLRGLAALDTPLDDGHAYLFGEFSVIKALGVALRDRGLADEAISTKAFWRAGRANQEHGEPDKS